MQLVVELLLDILLDFLDLFGIVLSDRTGFAKAVIVTVRPLDLGKARTVIGLFKAADPSLFQLILPVP